MVSKNAPLLKAMGLRAPGCAAAMLLMTSVALAQYPTPELRTVFPAGGRQGDVVTVQVSGSELDNAQQLLFSHPAISSRPVTRPPGEFEQEPQIVPGSFEVTIGEEVPVGIHEVRVVGRFGASNPRGFAVGELSETMESRDTDGSPGAQPLELPTIVNGRLEQGAPDDYSIQLTKGQVVVISCATRQIDSRCEAVVSMVDTSGKLLVRGRSSPERDTHLAFQAPADGRYVIRIHDAVYGSGSEYFYRLEVGSQPYIKAVFPPSGPAGELWSLTLFGYNLLPASTDPPAHVNPLQQADHRVLLPTSFAPLAVERDYFVAARSSVLAACPVKLEGSAAVPVFQASAPVLAEREPNDEPSAAHALPIPSECVGQFYPARDRDWFEFTAAKGQRLSIEVISNRLGLATDPALLVQKIERTEQGEERTAETQRLDDPADRERTIGDFDLLSDDPAYSFTADSDGLYRVMVGNNLGASLDDPTAMYRLCVRPTRPDFELVAIPLAIKTANRNQVPQWSPVLRRGGTTMIKVHVVRRDGFDADIQVSAENLPQGVTCPSVFLGGSESEVSLIFAAATDAPPAATAIRVVGRSTIGGEEVVRQAAAATLVWSSPNKQQQLPSYRAATDVVLSVTDAETVPVSVRPAAEFEELQATVGEMLVIPFRIERFGGFKDSIKLTPAGIPKDFQAKDVEAAGDSEEFLVTLAAAREGAFSCYVEGEAKLRYQRNPAAVAEAEQEHARLKTVVDDLKQSIGSAAEDDRKPDEQQSRNARLQRAEKALQTAEARVAAAKKVNEPKEITVPIFSTPIQIKVHPK